MMDAKPTPTPDGAPEHGCTCGCAKASQADLPRRGFFGMLFGTAIGIGTLAFSATAALWALATGRFFMPNVLTELPRKFCAGLPGDYPSDFVETGFKETHGVWLVNGTYQGRQQIFALDTTCTHLGCITLWAESEHKFKCPCHGSGFRMDGVNIEGPAPRPLVRYAVCVNDEGLLEIDKSRTFQEELGQWTDKACYVEV